MTIVIPYGARSTIKENRKINDRRTVSPEVRGWRIKEILKNNISTNRFTD